MGLQYSPFPPKISVVSSAHNDDHVVLHNVSILLVSDKGIIITWPILCLNMIETYKYTHSKYTVNEDLLVRNEDSVARGHSLKLQKRYCGSATRFNFYSFRSVDSWNVLPEDIVNAPTLDTFKARLDKCWSARKWYLYQIGYQADENTKQGLSPRK